MTMQSTRYTPIIIQQCETVRSRAAMVHKNRQVTVPEIAQKLNVSQGSLFSIVYDKLCFHIVCAQTIGRRVKVLLYGHLLVLLETLSRHRTGLL